MSGIMHKIEETLHMEGHKEGEKHKEGENYHGEEHRKEEHKGHSGEHKEGVIEKIKDKIPSVSASQTTCFNSNEVLMTEYHERWMAQYRRVYKDEAEKAYRYKIFKQNVEFIEAFNKAGTQSYKLGINQFADLTNEEFGTRYNGCKLRGRGKPPHSNMKT